MFRNEVIDIEDVDPGEQGEDEMAATTGVVIPIQTTEQGKQQVKEAVDNLGQKVSQLVQHYNDLRGQIEGDPSDATTKQKFRDLAEQRKAAVVALKDQYMSARQQAGNQGIAVSETVVPALAGFGRLGQTELNNLSSTVTTEESKLTILGNYYEAYKAALAAGTNPPPLPPELQTGFMGMPSWVLIAGVGLLLFFVMGKK